MKGSLTQRDQARYASRRTNDLKSSFEVEMMEPLTSELKKSTQETTVNNQKSPVDVVSNSEIVSMSETIRTSYDLLKEVKRQNETDRLFLNKLYPNKKINFDTGRNSTNPFNSMEVLKVRKVTQKRQSSDLKT